VTFFFFRGSENTLLAENSEGEKMPVRLFFLEKFMKTHLRTGLKY
jgi:hypothetical protein